MNVLRITSILYHLEEFHQIWIFKHFPGKGLRISWGYEASMKSTETDTPTSVFIGFPITDNFERN